MFILSRKSLVTAAILSAVSYQAQAGLVLSPIRCAADNLAQWNHDLDPAHYGADAPSQGTARGRQAWWKVCDPSAYSIVNSGSDVLGTDAEFDPTANHNNGTHTRWYPTFGVVTGIDPNTKETLFNRPGNYNAPTTAPATVGDSACMMPTSYKLVGMCASGCVTPEQEIRSTNGDLAIQDFETIADPAVLVPILNGTGVDSLESIPVSRFIKDGADAVQKIVILSMQSGGRLRVSVDHPLLVQDFTMQRAEDLTVGDQLVRADGSMDSILETHTEEYFGKLHNLTVDNSDLQKSLYIVNGYVSGDKKFQDTPLSDLNRQIFRNLVR